MDERRRELDVALLLRIELEDLAGLEIVGQDRRRRADGADVAELRLENALGRVVIDDGEGVDPGGFEPVGQMGRRPLVVDVDGAGVAVEGERFGVAGQLDVEEVDKREVLLVADAALVDDVDVDVEAVAMMRYAMADAMASGSG